MNYACLCSRLTPSKASWKCGCQRQESAKCHIPTQEAPQPTEPHTASASLSSPVKWA